MAAQPIEDVEVFDLNASAPVTHHVSATNPPDRATQSPTPQDRGAGNLMWLGSVLLLASVFLSLLTMNGIAYTATSRTPSQVPSNCHTDLAGDYHCDNNAVPSVTFTRRFDAWGTISISGDNAAGSFVSVPVGADTHGVLLGPTYLAGGMVIALALGAVAAATRWKRWQSIATRAVFGAAAVLVGIAIADVIGVIGARHALEYNDPTTPPENVLRTTFAVGSSTILAILATIAGVAGAVVLLRGYRRSSATPVAASSVTASTGAFDTSL